MPASGPWIEHFPGNMVWSNACLVTKGMAPYGAVALGEIDEICERLKAREGEYEAWEQEWCAMGARLEKIAEQAGETAPRGRPVHSVMRSSFPVLSVQLTAYTASLGGRLLVRAQE